MMELLEQIWSNKILMAALIAWAVAQLSKAVVYTIIYKEWRMERLWGSGGMPSSHAATVCALSVSSIFVYGLSSPEFAISFVLAAVVLHDARGVRLETGKQAKVLSAVTAILEKTYKGMIPDVELKELVGHTPLQVLIGGILGVAVGILVH